jgi:ligand-binding SRPBCC domain-containing protein
MKVYKFYRKQVFNTSLEILWDYLSSPGNLNEITPKELNFRIISDLPDRMYAGQIISYEIKVLPFIKYTWVTEIKNVIDKEYFIDEQRFGPYKFWHHQHRLEKSDKQVIMHDIVHYVIPFGIIGRILNYLLIENKLKAIFNYRFDFLEKKFNKKTN